ncbi:hypothetical protein [Solimonas flava]|uniref:hypothetical protein n=1 Tax=Solimonas flava TaxID=415849 RepID=UPI0012B592C7|nr:hypothetical protein [Solimonas flava]
MSRNRTGVKEGAALPWRTAIPVFIACSLGACAAHRPPPQTRPAPAAPEISQVRPEPATPPAADPALGGRAGPPPQSAQPKVYEADARGEVPASGVVPKAAAEANDPSTLDPSHLCDQRPPQLEQAIDTARRRVEEMVCSASMWFDGLFGDRYYLHESRRVYGSIELSENYSQFYGNKVRLRFDARVDLPNLDKRLSAFIGRDDEDDFISDRFDNTTLRNNFPQVRDHDRIFAGLGYSLPSNRLLQTSFRVGVRGLASPEAFVQGRLRYLPYADDRNLLQMRATPFWTTSDHLGITLGVDYSRVLAENYLARWSNVGTFSQSIQGFGWRSTWTLYQALRSIKSGLAYELFVRGETGDDVPLHEYGVQTTLRHPLLNQRLYVEWVLGYSFPRENIDDDRRGSVLLGAGVQMPFGQRR